MVPLALFRYLMCNALLALATLHWLHYHIYQLPGKPYPHLHHKTKMNGYIQSSLNHNQKFN